MAMALLEVPLPPLTRKGTSPGDLQPHNSYLFIFANWAGNLPGSPQNSNVITTDWGSGDTASWLAIEHAKEVHDPSLILISATLHRISGDIIMCMFGTRKKAHL